MSYSEFIKIYNGNILTQSKCGTRFLDKVFGTCEEIISLQSLIDNEYKDRFNVVIIRDPYEHLLSAISTTYDTYGTIDNQLDILSKGQDPHWNSNLYKYLYIYGLKNKITILHLKDMTNYIENVLNFGKHINERPYQTVKRTDKIFLDNLNKNHYEIWNYLQNLLKIEFSFYNKLIEENEVYQPKLKSI